MSVTAKKVSIFFLSCRQELVLSAAPVAKWNIINVTNPPPYFFSPNGDKNPLVRYLSVKKKMPKDSAGLSC